MKNKLRNTSLLVIFALAGFYFFNFSDEKVETSELQADITVKTKKKTEEERRLYTEERLRHEFNLQKNPITGEIPEDEKEKEYQNALLAKEAASNNRVTSSTYTSRGPTNFGGRTRAMAVDISDATSNTILAGGISSGMFRTTNGGSSWTKVSSNGEIHNVSCIAQDPRSGFQNIWYYGTGEWSGNSASLGSSYRGFGVWRSTDSGVTWSQIAATAAGSYESYDNYFDYVNAITVSPINGDLMVATAGKIYRLPGGTGTAVIELEMPGGAVGWTDVKVNSAGVVYASMQGDSGAAINGVWTSPTGNGSWTRIAQNGTPSGWFSNGRMVLATAPSNNDIVYAYFANGISGGIEADLWQYNANTTTWTDYSSTLPDEPGGDLAGNDPLAIQGGYDLVVSVKPNDENFVIIGGTNVYKIEDITTDPTFVRIGGYASNASYALYSVGGTEHHPDIHALEFDPNNNDVFYTGTDGGVHSTPDITVGSIPWTSLNNDYQTYQFYHVAMDHTTGSNSVIGGTQDNGTKIGGTDLGLPDATTMSGYYGGDGVAVGITRRNGGANYQFYYGSQNGNIRTNYPGFRSIIPAGSSSQFVTYFYLDPVNSYALYYAGQNILYRTTDAENVTTAISPASWQNMGVLPVNQNIRSFATSPGAYNASTSYLLIGGQNGGVFRLDDPHNATAANTAVNITPAGASTASGSVVSGLAIHPTNPDIAMAVYANYGITSIYITSNVTAASPTWTLVEQNLSAHSIRSAAIAEVGAETIYFVGTARGLYSNNDPTTKNWDIEGQNEMGLAVISGLDYRPADNKLIIGTHGNGMWETTVENTLSVNSFDELENKITIYPNPALSEINFKSNNFNLIENSNYNIVDINGKVVLSGTISNKKVDVSKLNTGLYFVNINANGIKQTLKFIKK
ncbi:MAG: T9SS type A sorting domain-containing protein [Flavobacteriaceae bacterium]